MANTNPPVKLMMLALAAPQEQQTPPQREVFESGQPLVVFLGVQKLESANGRSEEWDEKKWHVGLAKLDEFLVKRVQMTDNQIRRTIKIYLKDFLA